MRAFTLLELMVILVVTSVLAVVALPKFNDVSIHQVDALTLDLFNKVSFAQKTALAIRRPVYVINSSSQIKICLDNPCINQLKQIDGNFLQVDSILNYSFSFSQSVIQIDKFGRANSNSAITLNGKGIQFNLNSGLIEKI